MPANTSPDNIQYPTAGDQIAPLNTVFQNLAETTQAALTSRLSANVADFIALAALNTTGKIAGDLVFVVEGQVYMSWTGTVWRQVTTARFASTSARDTAYAKAGAVYQVEGVQALVTVSGLTFERVNAAWRPVGPYTTRRRSAITVASNASYTALSLSTTGVGSDFTHSNGVFTCALAGTYRATLTFSYATNAVGIRGTRLVGSGSLGTRTAPAVPANTGTDTTVTVEHHFTAAVSNTVTAQGIQNSGGSLAVEGAIVFERLN